MTQQPSELQELITAGIISEETAQQISGYWQQQQSGGSSRLSVIFSLLGGLLVGLGIILVVAHNWDTLSHFSKMVIAFLPVVVGQAAGLYTLLKQPQSRAWREGSSVFLIFALGACIAMVSQIYHLEGDMSDFLFSWIILVLPIMYVLDSALASLLFWLGISMYALHVGYENYPDEPAYWYLLFAVAAVPYYLSLRKRYPDSNYILYHDWAIPLSLAVCLGTLFIESNLLNWVNYQLLYAILFIIGRWLISQQEKIMRNGWMIVGLFATVFIGVAQSFYTYWDYREGWMKEGLMTAPNFYILVILFAVLVGLIVYVARSDRSILRHPLPYLGLLAIFIHWIGFGWPFWGALIGNLSVFGLGLYYIWLGTKKDHLAILNFGLMMLTVLIICRFFDTEMSFAIRGLLFLLLGAAFFGANIYLIRRRSKKDSL